jgi:hypothetical protein
MLLGARMGTNIQWRDRREPAVVGPDHEFSRGTVGVNAARGLLD